MYFPPIEVSGEIRPPHIATDKCNGGQLYTYLRHRRKRYRKRYGSHDRRGQLRNRVSISERPVEVENRERLGDWRVVAKARAEAEGKDRVDNA